MTVSSQQQQPSVSRVQQEGVALPLALTTPWRVQGSGPHPFWHQVLWKTLFPWTRVGGRGARDAEEAPAASRTPLCGGNLAGANQVCHSLPRCPFWVHPPPKPAPRDRLGGMGDPGGGGVVRVRNHAPPPSNKSKHTKQNHIFTHLPTSSDPTGEGILPPTPHPD